VDELALVIGVFSVWLHTSDAHDYIGARGGETFAASLDQFGCWSNVIMVHATLLAQEVIMRTLEQPLVVKVARRVLGES
jgi:hypothetical protein